MNAKKDQDAAVTVERSHVYDGSYQETRMRYAFMSERIPAQSKRVLDIGCGEGYGVDVLLERSQAVVGIDYDLEALRIARDRLSRRGTARFLAMDIAALGFADGCMDAVLSSEVIEHLQDPEQLLRQVQRILKPGGMMLVTTPNRLYTESTPLGSNPYHIREYTAQELKKLLEQYFSVEDLAGIFYKGRKFEQTGLFRVYFALKKFLGLERLRLSGPMRQKILNDLKQEDYFVSQSAIEKSMTLLAVCVKR